MSNFRLEIMFSEEWIDIKSRLRKRIESKGITLEIAAKEIGVNPHSLNGWIYTKGQPNATGTLRILKYLAT